MPLSPCARGCCWTPFGCAKPSECKCHWGDCLLTTPQNNGPVTTYRDPTSNQAIRNITRNERRPK